MLANVVSKHFPNSSKVFRCEVFVFLDFVAHEFFGADSDDALAVRYFLMMIVPVFGSYNKN